MNTTDSLNAFNLALARAGSGIRWSYPCLIWFADYARDATGNDPAAEWRGIEWDEAVAREIMGGLASQSGGRSDVERALATVAHRNDWEDVDAPRQGAVMVGVYTLNEVGVPAVFDGDRRWLIAGEDGARITSLPPDRMWVLG